MKRGKKQVKQITSIFFLTSLIRQSTRLSGYGKKNHSLRAFVRSFVQLVFDKRGSFFFLIQSGFSAFFNARLFIVPYYVTLS